MGRIENLYILWPCLVRSTSMMVTSFLTLSRIVILLTMAIYLRAGKEIYIKRKQLRNFSVPPPEPIPIMGDPFQSIKTTEVFVTSEAIASDSIDLAALGRQGPQRPQPAAPVKKQLLSHCVELSTECSKSGSLSLQ